MIPTTAKGDECDDTTWAESSLDIELPFPRPIRPTTQIKKNCRTNAMMIFEVGKAVIEDLDRDII